MRWQLKAALQYLLAPVPLPVRRKLQDVRGTAGLEIELIYPRKLQLIRRIQSHGLPIAGRTILEIGTGWHPLLPLLLVLAGAERVVGTDLNPWLTRGSLLETIRGVQQVIDRVCEDFGLDGEATRAQVDEWLSAAADEGVPLGEVLRRMRLEYACPVDACQTPFGNRAFDYIISSNVMEHLPPEVIRGIIEESRRILKPRGVHLHHVNPGDHFSYVDDRISSVNFLRFSPAAWRFIGGWGLGYHNRLRCVDFGRIFRQAGFEVFHEEVTVDQRALAALQNGQLQPHRAFAGYSNEELAGYVVDVFARQGPLDVGGSGEPG